MKLFIMKTAVVLFFAVLTIIFTGSIISTEDKTYTIVNTQVIYDLDTPQPSLNDMTMREVFEYNYDASGISQNTLDFWYIIYQNLI